MSISASLNNALLFLHAIATQNASQIMFPPASKDTIGGFVGLTTHPQNVVPLLKRLLKDNIPVLLLIARCRGITEQVVLCIPEKELNRASYVFEQAEILEGEKWAQILNDIFAFQAPLYRVLERL